MDSWVTSLIKDFQEKVGISGHSSSTAAQSSVSAREYEVPVKTDKSFDYYPSRLPPSELRLLVQYVLRMRQKETGENLVHTMGRLLFMEDLASKSSSSTPYLQIDMSKLGHACITAPLGERTWPPEAGYTFVCWFQYRKSKRKPTEDQEKSSLRLFSVCPTYKESTCHEELYLHEDGVLTLTACNANSLSSSSLELEEGQWYHLAVNHSKTNEGLTSVVSFYLNGKIRHTGELASPPIQIENWQVNIGTPAKNAIVSDLCWRLRSCYLFDEKLSADCIHAMYILGQGYKVEIQGLDNMHLISGNGSGDMAIKPDSNLDFGKLGSYEPDSKEAIWDIEMLEKLWLEIFGKKLLCAFNAARIEGLRGSETLALLNLVDPMSAVTPSSGVPLFGHCHGDIFICRRCVTGNIIHPITEIAVVLALVEAAKTNEMCHIALKLLASALHQNPVNSKEMKLCKGYHLLSLFLHRKMSLFDMKCLEIIFKIAVPEDNSKLNNTEPSLPSSTIMPEASFMDVFNSAEFQEDKDVDSYHENIDDFYENRGEFNHDIKLQNNNTMGFMSISGALCDADIVEHVLLDWTIWVTAPTTIQMSIVNFLEHLVSVYEHKDHNLTLLRERNIAHHLLITLHRDDVELPILEKMAILLSIILEDQLLGSELESVTKFLISTFHPIKVPDSHHIWKEIRNQRVILRNILLETLIDLQIIIRSEELVEQWHSIVSSRLITFFLDEAVHPTTMAWIVTLLGCCLTYSPTFALKFQTSQGYEALVQILPGFHNSLDIYYALFCLMLNKPLYPKLPEVGIQDFETLMPTDGDNSQLKFPGLLDSIISMAKSSFEQPRVEPVLEQKAINTMQTTDETSVEENKDIVEEENLEAFMDRTYSAQLSDWETSASNAASILRLMANLAKMWPSFSYTCRRVEFLESCVDLYFSIVRASCGTNLVCEKPAENASSQINFDPFLTIHDSGYSRDPGASGAMAVIDLIAEIISDTLIRQTSSVSLIESILASVPLHFGTMSLLKFPALCLDRVMNYLERRLVQGDEGNAPKLDKNSLWSNLGSFCNLIVDSVYLGVFDRPSSVIRVLEFCLSMLHYAKKDGQMAEPSLPWTGLLSILRGSKPFNVILKSTIRMILYCFLPSFLASIGEDALVSSTFKAELDQQYHPPSIMDGNEAQSEEIKKEKPSNSSQEEIKIDICIVLELLHAHKQAIFNPSNIDPDLYCSLCINLIALFPDHRNDARDSAISIFKYLLVHSRAALETMLVLKPTQERSSLDVLNGGLDRLLTESVPSFMEWFNISERYIKKVLQHSAGNTWAKYIEESRKFPGERLKFLEDNRRRKMTGKEKEEEVRKIRYREQCEERRVALESIRETVCSTLEFACERKWEDGLRAESEWRSRIQQFGHEHKVEPVSDMTWEDYWPVC